MRKPNENMDYPIIDIRVFLKSIDAEYPSRFFRDDATFILLTRKP